MALDLDIDPVLQQSRDIRLAREITVERGRCRTGGLGNLANTGGAKSTARVSGACAHRAVTEF
jgi:hypothetical protein